MPLLERDTESYFTDMTIDGLSFRRRKFSLQLADDIFQSSDFRPSNWTCHC